MFQKHWPVLFVDDDPDVLSISKLVLKDVRVDGVPVQLHTAASKAEAIQILATPLGRSSAPYVAVAFIDVVMETDQAGLELCEYIRETMRNKTTQIYVRTGQAGVAPERSVIDRYDINGYFSKLETTEDKLYSLVKAGVRQHEYMTSSLILFQLLSQAVGQSNQGIKDMMNAMARGLKQNVAGADLGQYALQLVVVIGDEPFIDMGVDQDQALAEYRRLDALPGTALGGGGDKYVFDRGSLLLKAAATTASDAGFMVYTGVEEPGSGRALLDLSFLKALASIVKANANRLQPSRVG